MSISPTPEDGNDIDKEEKTYSPFLGAKLKFIKQLEVDEKAQEEIKEIQEKQEDLT
jgi:hypothetical protein